MRSVEKLKALKDMIKYWEEKRAEKELAKKGPTKDLSNPHSYNKCQLEQKSIFSSLLHAEAHLLP